MVTKENKISEMNDDDLLFYLEWKAAMGETPEKYILKNILKRIKKQYCKK